MTDIGLNVFRNAHFPYYEGFTTIYGMPTRTFTDAQLLELYRTYYADKPFVRVRNGLPATKDT